MGHWHALLSNPAPGLALMAAWPGASAETAARPDGPPVLLTDATWYGTLAAARDLGGRGVPVVLASDAALPPARWSRHVTRTVRCPSTSDPERFLEWLHAFGDREPGHVYYPTSDDAAWLTALHHGTLSSRFRLYAPPLPALALLLDKGRLMSAAAEAGLAVPETWCPGDEAEVARLAAELPFPILLKPRTQVLSPGGHKGVRVERPADLAPTWVAWQRRAERQAPRAGGLPGAELPILQRCHVAQESVYTVDGFAERGGRAVPMLACRKLLQHPRRSGPGIAFEAAPVEPAVGQGLRRLLAGAGFHGVFDAEFLEDGGRHLLIDLNPRFYNHMAFEVDRGLPLPWLAYLGALGEEGRLEEALAACAAPRIGPERVFAHRLPLRLLVLLQRLTGAMSGGEARRWREWLASHSQSLTDPSAGAGDGWPALADVLLHLKRALRHPRSTWRGYVRRHP
jgi:predicted ATP-grasp superfamily ATP-dependent carboligase